jgi:hypothetical protein
MLMSFPFSFFLIIINSFVSLNSNDSLFTTLLNIPFSISDSAILQNRISPRKIGLLHQSDVCAKGTIKIKIY